MVTLDALVEAGAAYLEGSARCPKHRVEHTGSLCYLLDFYGYLGEHGKAKRRIEHLLSRIVETEAGFVFYPGHIDPMNMSQNVIDTGAAVDCIARYLDRHRDAFTADEHRRSSDALGQVVETYLKNAAAGKSITNQRLWGLTGLASFARYTGSHAYDDVIRASIERAFSDMTEDGYFLYMPHAGEHGNFEGYDGITEFYQSRCSAFIRYALAAAQIDVAPYEARLQQSERALLAMYRADGTKDLRLECKRWYWQSSYEVAASGFDIYALAHSKEAAATGALHNALFQVRRHFRHGRLRSHIGFAINFQCPIFWTAHLAWLLRSGLRDRFDAADALVPFAFRFEGHEVFTDTNPARRILANARFQERNFNEGTIDNGLPSRAAWHCAMPHLPPAFLFSIRETINHTWYALRGGYVLEAAVRLGRFARECLIMLLPRFDIGYGQIESYSVEPTKVSVRVRPATKYGTLSPKTETIEIDL